MNILKKNGGFTLVELIVVIAILAILAGVAIPAYSGYIEKANQAADIVTCDAIKTAVFAAYAEEGDVAPDSITVENGSLQVDGVAITGNYATNFEIYYGAEVADIEIKGSSASWTKADGEWTITPAA